MSTPYDGFEDNSPGFENFDYGNESSDHAQVENKPRILLMGLRRSGKSSIQKVVFHKFSPNETLFLESTTKMMKDDISNGSFFQFQIWDFPGQLDFFDPTFDSDVIFGGCGCLIFVIDTQEDYTEALSKLLQTMANAHKVNPNISFEVFIHKVDGLSEEFKNDCEHDIIQQVEDALASDNLNIVPNFYLTSIYDHSIFEAFSKVVQKLIPQLGTLENLLDVLIQKCQMEKVFLFDVASKIYVATDTKSVDMLTYELCSDMIDVVSDVSSLYGYVNSSNQKTDGSSVMKLNNNLVLFMQQIDKYLALVCLIHEDNFDKHGLIDYNIIAFQKELTTFFSACKKAST